MAFEKLSDGVHDVNDNIQNYIQSNTEYYKLRAFKQGMKGASALVRFLILGLLLTTSGIMLSFALAIVISQSIGVPSSGYFIVGGVYLIICVLLFFFAKEPIEKLVLKKFSKIMFNEKDKK